ncbi:MAG: hypothetical protein Q9222_000565 [Ikaeria aurantiellina]
MSPSHASPPAQQPLSTRARRSNSTSSLSSVASSLSSVDPNLTLQVEDDLDARTSPLPSSAAQARGSRSAASAGPKMGIFTTSNKRSLAATQPSKEDEELAAKRRKLRQTFDDYAVGNSDVRTSVAPLPNSKVSHRSSPRILQHAAPAEKRSRGVLDCPALEDESEELDSPTTSMHSELLVPPPPFAESSRRGGTPTNLGRPPKATKKSARVKMSPLKKRNGVVAGMPRSGGVRHSPIGSNLADGDGLDAAPDGEWYCQACASQPLSTLPRRIFALLRHSVQRRNPAAYNLPRSLRCYYEDVITGDDGEYEEANIASKAKSRGGYDLPVDTLRLKDSKDNTILCYKCNKSAMGGREIIDCDFCNLHWHLDCVDPPLASAPKRFGKGTWKCPNHIDSEITLPRSASGKTYKVRRPKDPRVIETALTRGIKNNGIIEIADEVSEEEDQPPGTIFRLPAKAIKLDFISKIKQANQRSPRTRRHQVEAFRHANDRSGQRKAEPASSSSGPDGIFQGRSAVERQAALSLADFAHSDPKSQLAGDRVEELVNTLISEAPIDLPQSYDDTWLESSIGDQVPDTNGVSTRAKTAASNKAAHAVNQASVIATPPPSDLHFQAPPSEDLAEMLKLEAILKAKIAAMRSASTAI